MVNHWGTIILAEPLELPDGGRRYIDEDTDWNYAPFGGTEKNQKPCVTAEEFIKTYVKQKRQKTCTGKVLKMPFVILALSIC